MFFYLMETLTRATYCGIPVSNEFDKIPQVFFDELENYFTQGYCSGFLHEYLNNDFIMAIARSDNQFDGAFRQIMYFMMNRIPAKNLYWGSEKVVKDFIFNRHYFTREQLIERYNLG